MTQHTHSLQIPTRGKGLYEITDQISRWLGGCPVRSGLLTVFIQHTSASLTIQENADPDVVHDLNAFFDRLVAEARHEIVVINDSDVRARPDYLRSVVAPLADPKVGAVTCFYLPIEEHGFAESLQNISMLSDFYAGVLVAKQLDGVKFALGTTIATRRSCLAKFGGYKAIENRPGDDLLVGRLIAEQGYEVKLLPYTISTVADYQSVPDLLHKRMRWLVVMRHMRPWGHLGLLLTLYATWRGARRLSTGDGMALAAMSPWAVLAGALYSAGVWIVFQPMQMRGMMMH